MTRKDRIVPKEEKIRRYFDSYIKLREAQIKNLRAKRFRMLVENEKNCNLITYPYYWLKWRGTGEL